MEQKTCTFCRKSKPVDLFRFRTEKDKTHLRHSRCIECVNTIKYKNRKERGHLHKFNTEFQKEYDKAYYLLHKEKKKEAARLYQENNKEKVNLSRRKQIKEREKIDIKFKIQRRMSRAIRAATKSKGIKKNGSWQYLVGYGAEELKEHLEKQFTPEMTWENHGSYWHIDHIRPKSWFNFTSTDDPEFKKCWALDNLQPLPKNINFKKSNKWEG